MISLDADSKVPAYLQIVRAIQNMILADILRADESVPSVRSLARDLGADPNTVQRAYTVLKNEGYIYSAPGKGNFVSGNAHELRAAKQKRLMERLAPLINEACSLEIKKEDLLRLINNVYY